MLINFNKIIMTMRKNYGTMFIACVLLSIIAFVGSDLLISHKETFGRYIHLTIIPSLIGLLIISIEGFIILLKEAEQWINSHLTFL